ncbi:AAA family ATPase [Marinobacter salarius]|uniref:AAA family ATPase n=1 Tax=Marinobacter salarius TaxID=1420917 RepID=UPI00273A812E|nr:AAA family ATPase [Marinobacter salarius]MDP4533705.1 AAA family ATPase [Marinobacter salarius]
MKIKYLKIVKWRNFENIELLIPGEATLVALIGENGAGKSSILDIINSAAHRLGLSAGVDIPRGDPFSDDHDFRIDAYINRDAEDLLNQDLINQYQVQGVNFDGCISIVSRKGDTGSNTEIFLTSYEENSVGNAYANVLINALRNKEDTHHLSLDADRSYPPKPVQAHEYAQSLDQDWGLIQFKKNRAHVSSRNKYDEWMKYCVGTEAKCATESFQAQRLAAAQGTQPPEFVDNFASYGSSIKEVLPHLKFLGVDTKDKTLIFDSTGTTLSFNQLSGGEREIAFVVGQIERFELSNGILTIDEPELHLNPEMVRAWISYLRDTVEDGQTWIATHSMEAVEAAGLECTFVIERDQLTKQVSQVVSLDNQPALSILSSAIGSPAFSLSKKSFIFIEGDRQGVERDKFYRLYSTIKPSVDIRFMEGGGCKDVERKVEACNILSEETDQQLHVGGIIDKDFRNDEEHSRLRALGLFVLPFHEIENAFLYPPVLQIIVQSNGINDTPKNLIKMAADKVAGKWIIERAKFRAAVKINNKRQIDIFWSKLKWEDIRGKCLEELAAPEFECKRDEDKEALQRELRNAIHQYGEITDSEDLWAQCDGKQVISVLPPMLGFSKQIALVNNVCSILNDNIQISTSLFGDVVNYIDEVRAQGASTAPG